MSKNDEQILVVSRQPLFQDEVNHFYGFLPFETETAQAIVKQFEHYQVKRRGDMEEDPTFKQLISYVIIRDKQTQDILVYQRLTGGDESRLHGKASIGVGGHMNESQATSIYAVLEDNALREIAEEVGIAPDVAKQTLTCIGLINDDTQAVGQVHLGVVYLCDVDKTQVTLLETETLAIDWLALQDAKQKHNYETWSALILEKLDW